MPHSALRYTHTRSRVWRRQTRCSLSTTGRLVALAWQRLVCLPTLGAHTGLCAGPARPGLRNEYDSQRDSRGAPRACASKPAVVQPGCGAAGAATLGSYSTCVCWCWHVTLTTWPSRPLSTTATSRSAQQLMATAGRHGLSMPSWQACRCVCSQASSCSLRRLAYSMRR